VLLDGWLGKLLEDLLNEGRYVDRLHVRKIMQPFAFTPSRKPACRLIVGAPVFLLRMLAVKNSQKRSDVFGSGRNNAGGLALTVARVLRRE
jgi:hypothetical protein